MRSATSPGPSALPIGVASAAATSAEGAQPTAGAAGGPASVEVDVADVVTRALSLRKDKDDVGPLVAVLGLKLPRVDLYVLGELARLGAQVASYRPQVEALLERPDESVRAACAKALGQMRDPAVSGRLLGLLGSDASASVRAAAAEALGELQQSEGPKAPAAGGLRSETAHGVSPESGPAVVQALSDPAPEVRQAATLAVAKLKWAAGGSAVAGRLEMDRDVRVRELAAYALGELGGTQWADALAQALAKDPSSRVRLNAAEALGKVEARGALDVLVAALEDADIHVREAVVVALGRLGDPRAVAPLEQLLGRVATAEALPAKVAPGAPSAGTGGAKGPAGVVDPTESLATRVWQTLMRLVADDPSALRQLAFARYRVGDRERAREAAQRLVDRFGSVEGATEAWSGMVLLGVLANQRGNPTQAEPLLRQALSSLEGAAVLSSQVRSPTSSGPAAPAMGSPTSSGPAAPAIRQLGDVLGVGGSLKEYLQDQLVTALSASGRGREALVALDDMVKQDPANGDRWWARRYEVLLQLAQAGEWPTVAFYLQGAAKSGPGYGGTGSDAYQKQLEELFGQAGEALTKMSSRELVGLWLQAPDDVAGSLEPRLRARGREAPPTVVVALVDALEEQDVRSRGRAVVLLRALSGQNLAFDPEGTPEERAVAVARWRSWLERPPEPPSGRAVNGSPAVSKKPLTPTPAPAAAGAGVPANK